MELIEARSKFVQAWGTLGTQWGINRTMAQIHSLLLVSPDPLTTDEIMEQLHISRGNANMNLRSLRDWGLVKKEHKKGDRKEYFSTSKDLWDVSRKVITERRKKELEPIISVLNEVSEVDGDKDDKHIKAFNTITKKLRVFAEKADRSLEKISYANEHWFFGSFMNLKK